MSMTELLFIIIFLVFALFFFFVGWKNIRILLDEWENIKYNKTRLGKFVYIAGFVSAALLFTILGCLFIYFMYVATTIPCLFLD
jgi:uncharacterized membrane protein